MAMLKLLIISLLDALLWLKFGNRKEIQDFFLIQAPQNPAVILKVVEITKGSKVKYEPDKKTGLFKVDRVLYSSAVYPHNCGFILCAHSEDDDPMDALVLKQGENDDKIIAACIDDPHCLAEIWCFFEDYKKNENKEVAVNEFLPADMARDAIQYSINDD